MGKKWSTSTTWEDGESALRRKNGQSVLRAHYKSSLQATESGLRRRGGVKKKWLYVDMRARLCAHCACEVAAETAGRMGLCGEELFEWDCVAENCANEIVWRRLLRGQQPPCSIIGTTP